MATRLNQIIAVEKGVKANAARSLTDAYHAIQRAPQLTGISRQYRPKDDDGDTLPAEQTLVQVKVEDVLQAATADLVRLFDVTLTKDASNAVAKADVKVDGQVILPKVPVTYLLFLAKQLVDLNTLISHLPTLDPAEEWHQDPSTGTWRTPASDTHRTKKVMRNHVKAEATDKHPAQVDTYTEDVIVGYWTTTKFSGALPAARVSVLKERVAKLITAVEFAREEANNTEVVDAKAGTAILDYVFAP